MKKSWQNVEFCNKPWWVQIQVLSSFAFVSEIEKNFTYVGKKFPEEARKIHYGEAKDKPIYGEATEKESQELVDEGIGLVRLPFSKKEKNKN